MSEARPILMSPGLVDGLGWRDRATVLTETTCVVRATEEELLAKWPADALIRWGEPDHLGRYSPVVYTGELAAIYASEPAL